jgi:hypothetical protein
VRWFKHADWCVDVSSDMSGISLGGKSGACSLTEEVPAYQKVVVGGSRTLV